MGEWRQVSKTPAACLEPSQCKTSGTAEAMVFFLQLHRDWWYWRNRWDSARILLDPYAPLVKGRSNFAQRDEFERYEEKVMTRTWLPHMLSSFCVL